MACEQKITATGAILYDPERVGKPNDEIFEVGYWEDRSKIVARATGRGGVIFIREEDRYWVLRHYRRGGLIAKLLRDSYLWLGYERTRAFREWRLLYALRIQGLPVPAPVATRVVRNGFTYRADLITEALPATRTLADAITGVTLPENQWNAIGRTIASLHRAGVHHADLNSHNILLGEGGKVFVLDFDRGKIRSRGAWENDVIARLKRSLLKIQRQRKDVKFDERAWSDLIGGYQNRDSVIRDS